MPRPPRIEGEYFWYHVLNRGNEKRDVFLTDEDHMHFLDTVFAKAEEFTVNIHAYALMINHFHLLLMTRHANLSSFMHDTQSVFVQDYNRVHERVGHLFGGRYKPIVVDTQEYLHELTRYIHLNHVRGKGLAGTSLRDRLRDLRDYPWSSFRVYAGLERCRWPLRTNVVLADFGDTPHERRRRYIRYVKEGLLEEVDPFKNVIQGCILGSEEFASRLLKRDDTHVGRDGCAAAKVGRIKARALEEVVDAVCEVCGAEPEAIMAAHKRGQVDDARRLLMWSAAKWCRGKLSLAEIGKRLGGVTAGAVRWARRHVEDEICKDATIGERVEALRQKLDGELVVLPGIADREWVEMFERLRAFHERYGHVLVPRECAHDLALGAWVARQRMVRLRKACNAQELSEEQIRLLDELGFRW
jgi:putative transposase